MAVFVFWNTIKNENKLKINMNTNESPNICE